MYHVPDGSLDGFGFVFEAESGAADSNLGVLVWKDMMLWGTCSVCCGRSGHGGMGKNGGYSVHGSRIGNVGRDEGTKDGADGEGEEGDAGGELHGGLG